MPLAFVFKNVPNSSDVNCGPISVFSNCDRPCVHNILSRLPIMVADVTDLLGLTVELSMVQGFR